MFQKVYIVRNVYFKKKVRGYDNIKKLYCLKEFTLLEILALKKKLRNIIVIIKSLEDKWNKSLKSVKSSKPQGKN